MVRRGNQRFSIVGDNLCSHGTLRTRAESGRVCADRGGRGGAREAVAVTPEDRLGEALKQASLAMDAESVSEDASAEIEGAIVVLRRARRRLQLTGESSE